MLQEIFGTSQWFACNVVGLARSINRRPLTCETLTDPDRWLRTRLCKWAGIARNARKGYRRAWADLLAEGYVVKLTKVQRLLRDESLRVEREPRRKRAGSSVSPITTSDAPNLVWIIDFQFDSLRSGTLVKLAPMVHVHTRESILQISDWSITSEKDIDDEKKFSPNNSVLWSCGAIASPNSFPARSTNSFFTSSMF